MARLTLLDKGFVAIVRLAAKLERVLLAVVTIQILMEP